MGKVIKKGAREATAETKKALRLCVSAVNKNQILPSLDSHKEEDMTLLGFIILLIIAAICGALAQALAGYSLGGLFASIAVGFIGAFLGVWIARQFGFPEFLTIN